MRYRLVSVPLFLGSVPASVLLVNVIGSLILGASSTAVSQLGLDERYTILIGIGFCGSLTTMSSFAYETVGLASAGQLAAAGVDVVLNVGASLGAIILGRALVTLFLGLG